MTPATQQIVIHALFSLAIFFSILAAYYFGKAQGIRWAHRMFLSTFHDGDAP